MSRFQWITWSLILLVIRPVLSCNPVSEYDNRNITTTSSSFLLGYQLQPCPEPYRLASIINAELSNPSASQSNILKITDLLSARCLRQNTTLCSVDIPLQGLDVRGAPTVLNVKVNYTCQLDHSAEWPAGSMFSSITTNVTETSSVKYILTSLIGSGSSDWNCTFSSSDGSSVTGSWMSSDCEVTTSECLNGVVSASPAAVKNGSLFCLEPQSIGRILLLTDKLCPSSSLEIVLLNLQVPLGSDFDIACIAQTKSNTISPTDQISKMSSDCSQLTWTTSTSAQPAAASPNGGSTQSTINTERFQPSTSTNLLQEDPIGGTTQGTRGTETPVGAKAMTPVENTTLSKLGLGLGIALGILLLIAVIAITVICIRRKNRGFDANTSNLAKSREHVGGVMEDKDGGFVLANDVFTVQNIYMYSQLSDDIILYNNASLPSVPREETAEIGYQQEPTPPASTSPPAGDVQPKRATSLSRRLFQQIAKLAKQEERGSQDPVKGDAPGRSEGTHPGEAGDSQTSLVDRWLYSSTLNSAENTLNINNNNNGDAIYINRRFEMDV